MRYHQLSSFFNYQCFYMISINDYFSQSTIIPNQDYGWHIIQKELHESAVDASDKESDFKWCKSIMDQYLLNNWLTIGNDHSVLTIWDRFDIDKFIPNVKANEFHLLTAKDEKKIILINNTTGQTPRSVAFKLRYSTELPFIVMLEIQTNIDEMNNGLYTDLLINDTWIKLSENEYNPRTGCVDYFLGEEHAEDNWAFLGLRKYSYLPAFKNIFKNDDGNFVNTLKMNLWFHNT